MLTLRLGNAQGAELVSLANNASESVVEDDHDVLDEEDDDDEESDDQDGQAEGRPNLLSHRYFLETAAATAHHHDEFLPESVVLALISDSTAS